MRPIPTALDHKWLRQQLTCALTAAGESLTLPRPTVELMVCVLDLAADAGHARPPKAVRYPSDADDLRPAVLLELQRLAADGEAPSKARWDQQRQAELPSAQHVCRILRARWPQLCQAAGLRLNRHAQRSAWRVDDDPSTEQPAAEQPVQQPPILQAEDYVPLPVASSRTEVRTVGNVRITSTYHALR